MPTIEQGDPGPESGDQTSGTNYKAMLEAAQGPTPGSEAASAAEASPDPSNSIDSPAWGTPESIETAPKPGPESENVEPAAHLETEPGAEVILDGTLDEFMDSLKGAVQHPKMLIQYGIVNKDKALSGFGQTKLIPDKKQGLPWSRKTITAPPEMELSARIKVRDTVMAIDSVLTDSLTERESGDPNPTLGAEVPVADLVLGQPDDEAVKQALDLILPKELDSISSGRSTQLRYRNRTVTSRDVEGVVGPQRTDNFDVIIGRGGPNGRLSVARVGSTPEYEPKARPGDRLIYKLAAASA